MSRETTIKRAYAAISPVYDVFFDKIFHSGRLKALESLNIGPGNHILEVGVGTGLSLPLYPRNCLVTGIDLSKEMLSRARERATLLDSTRFALHLMDGANLGFADNSFDHVLAAYVISVVQDPVKALQEMCRVCRPGGNLVILNHFRSDNRIIGKVEDLLSPLCCRIGFNTDVKLRPLMKRAGLTPVRIDKVNILNGWRLIQCINPSGRESAPSAKHTPREVSGRSSHNATTAA